MKRVVLITSHYWNSKRKAGFHCLANAYWKMGWEVIFVTAPISWLSWLRHDYRFNFPILKEANQLIWAKERFASYVLFTNWHPANLRNNFLNKFAWWIYPFYRNINLGLLKPYLAGSDLIIFESTPALLLFNKVKSIVPSAKFVYRVSDDIRLLKFHPYVIANEKKIAAQFDLVSSPCAYIHNKFSDLSNARLQYHGIEKELFNQCATNPYRKKRNVIFVGNSYFDYNFLENASDIFPDWMFHIIGPIGNLPVKQNIKIYGEIPFQETIKYIKFADIGLHTLYSSEKDCDSFTDSLKVLQYTYNNLPVIAPNFLKSFRKNMFYYIPGEKQSIEEAFHKAMLYDRKSQNDCIIQSWDELAHSLVKK